jgi:sulfite reductase alpha subunit-like flavoprotein
VQEVRHVEFDLGADGPTYEPGDALAIAPLTPAADAAALLARLGIAADAVLRVSTATADDEAAGGDARSFVVAARHLVRGALDVCSAPPRRTLFELLARTASAPHEASRLALFGSAAGRDEMSRYAQRERRSLAEVLADFPSAAPPLEMLLQAAPRARPRLYSISSSPAACPHAAHITAAVARWATPLKRPRAGLLTPQLAAALLGSAFAVWTERGALRLPADAATPLLMIGPGTGVAPFRGFVQHRSALAAADAAAPDAGAAAALFFGCRAAAGDFLYAAEWAAAAAPGGVLAAEPRGGGFFAAFSRDAAAKAYVTHDLRREGARVWRLLAAGAHVFVAGSGGAMPRDVFDALTDVVSAHGGMAAPDAAAFLRRLEAQRRYTVEVWS